MSQTSPSRPRARSNVTVRITRGGDDTSHIERHNFYISPKHSPLQKRVPSPLASTHIPYDRAISDQVRSAGRSPRSPLYSAAALTAASSGSQSSPTSASLPSPSSPNRQKGSSGDKTFDSLKAAASRHALLEKTREEAKTRARDERIHHMRTQGMSGSASGPQLSAGDGTPSPRLPAMSSAPIQVRTDLAAKRTTSFDSTMSLSQSPSQPFQPQIPMEDPRAVDIPALIAAAGSPEAAIRKLLHEKHEAAKMNAQLWRLLNKHQGVLDNLNKDLQKATKDKDRYRRKLKEQLMSSASISTIPGSAVQGSIAHEREDSQSPNVGELPEELGGHGSLKSSIASERTDDNLNTPFFSTSNLSTTPASSIASPMYQKPMAAPFADRSDLRSPLGGSELGTLNAPVFPEHRIPTGSPAVLAANDLMDPVQSREQVDRHDTDSSSRTPKGNTMTPKLGFSTATKDRTQSVARKAPPAPLDLSPQKSTQMLENARSSSSSNYAEDDSSGSARLERGRRQTREDDERDREVELQEREDRDRSAKARRDEERLKLERLQRPPLERDISLGNLSAGSGYSSPEEAGSPHIAQVQTYQSLNALNTTVKTPQDAEFTAELRKSLAQHSVSSPGLPISPRPSEWPGTAPNPAARNLALSTFPNTLPASPRNPGNFLSPRAPKQPIPMPPQTPLSVASPHLLRAESYQKQVDQRQAEPDTAASESPESDRVMPLPNNLTPGGPRTPGDIYKGFMTDQWPGLLLPPNALPSIFVKVDSSRLRPSRYSYMAPKNSQENPVFSLAVYARSDNMQLWRIEKTLNSLTLLDTQLKSLSKFRMRLPDRALFAGHAPARIDARRSALGKYFDVMLDTPMDEQAASVVCGFFSSDTIGAEVKEYFQPTHTSTGSTDSVSTSEIKMMKSRKDGYLTKKGKNFGGWIARYFVCDGPVLKYFEAPGGAQLGAIKLQYASIGRQTAKSAQEELDEENQFRHAFLILEPKKRDKANYVKHVLCAESDEERDAWVKCLMQYIENQDDKNRPMTARLTEKPESPKSPRVHKSMNDIRKQQDAPVPPTSSEMQTPLRAVIYDNTTAADAPVMGPFGITATNSPSPPAEEFEEKPPFTPLPVISGPTNGSKIEDVAVWGNKKGPNVLTKEYRDRDRERDKEKDKEKKRSLFGFKGRSSTESTARENLSQKDHSAESPHPRPVFGAALADAVEFAGPTDVPVRLPAVVYRCIEYMRAKDAINEEGIFRMSGSNLVIRGLKERFNTEGDVHLLAPGEQMYDIHAVASLLKLYLRELPSTILTRDLHLDFAACLELDGKTKLEAFNILVNRLPEPNRELLEKLTAFLREIVDNEAVNKMNVRNVGIVFSPTLNIPAPLISLFVTDHGKIFGPPIDIATVESKLPELLSSKKGSSAGGRLTVNTDDAQTARYRLHPEQPTPSSDTSFMQQLSGADYSTAQQLFKQQYDTAYTPPQSAGPHNPTPPAHVTAKPSQRQQVPELSSLPRKISEASEPPISPVRLAHINPSAQPHTSFHSMHFPDPPVSASGRPPLPIPQRPSNASSHLSNSSPKSQHSTSSTSTLTNGQGRESLALSSAASSNASRSASTTSGVGPNLSYSKIALGNLNDITISSSPLMGGTSPEFNRSGFSPHNSVGPGNTGGLYSTNGGYQPYGQQQQQQQHLEPSQTAPQIGSSPLSREANMQTSLSGPVGGLNPYSPSMYSARSGGSSGGGSGSGGGTPGGSQGGLTPNPYAPSSRNPYSPNAHEMRTGLGERQGSAASGSTAERHGSLGGKDAERQGSQSSAKSGGSGGKEGGEGFGRRLLRRQSGNFLVRAGLLDEKKEKVFVGGGMNSPTTATGTTTARKEVGLGVSSPRSGGFGRRDG
ncbi:hypothetical protein CAC42_6008 [Sphaceloma murrayae]|uniref:RhoGAP-domain-containing protein n=1 Tax=Sphaceloma murrayae TaxID=2082308 RepID=A0A2K1QZU4_9PEZI|nr:hypothetical protein CAC42_6008 [Sphaceloma murrayae]